MQAQGKRKRSKFNINDHQNLVKGKLNESSNSELHCVCDKKDNNKQYQCFRCNEYQHQCLQGRIVSRECLKCIARQLDPMFTVNRVLAETCFKTNDVEQYENVLNIRFEVQPNDTKLPIEVRGTQPNSKNLAWPMHGLFYINEQKIPFHQLRPLLVNSNRKARRQQYFTIPKEKIIIGQNILTFRIPRLKITFKDTYQLERQAIYFFGVYSIKKLTKEELVQKVINESRLEKPQSLKLLKTLADSDITVEREKIGLMCPFTRERIRVPVRGKNCPHYACVCLETMIAHHQKIRTWACPICKKDSRINQPKIDMWIYEILHQNLHATEVIFSLDGTYEWVQPKNKVVELSDSDKDDADSILLSINKFDPLLRLQVQNSLKGQDNEGQQESHQKILIKDPKKVEIILDDDQEVQSQQLPPIPDLEIRIQKNKKGIQANKAPSQLETIREICGIQELPKPSKFQFKDNISMQKRLKNDFNAVISSFKNREVRTEKSKVVFKPTFVGDQPLIFDLTTLEFKEMTINEYHTKYFKPNSKSRVPQEIKRIFKPIL